MKKIASLFFLIGVLLPIYSQDLTAEVLLDKTLQYHDPNGLWDEFKASFFVTMESPKRPLRKSEITLDLSRSFFDLKVKIEENKWSATLNGEECTLTFNDSAEITPEIEKEFRLNCDRAKMYRDYYSYLYGLPMKLKDPGTRIDPKVNQKSIDGVAYWVLRVTYDPSVGSDVWYFYFDQTTYALKRYQFFHDESKNDGEYVILKDELNVAGIRMPRDRSWYYNSDDTYLGTDLLSN